MHRLDEKQKMMPSVSRANLTHKPHDKLFGYQTKGTAAMSMNLLQNAGFDVPQVTPTEATYFEVIAPATAGNGDSAAQHWTTWSAGTGSSVSTDLIKSTRPGSHKRMIHVCTTTSSSGVVQVFGAQKPDHTFDGPAAAKFTVWVYVLRGVVGAGAGAGGNTGLQAFSASLGKWEQLSFVSNAGPVSEFIVDASSPSGACFYVEDADVRATP